MTTDETTSHPTKQPEDGCQVVGYSHLTGETTSQSTKPPKDSGKVAGYNPAKDAGQVIDETTSHLTKAASCQVIGYGYSHSTRLSKDDNQVAGYVEEADKMLPMTHPSGNSNAKVFFALWPTTPERDLLVSWQKPLQHLCGGRFMHSENLHNTLVFIGNVEQSRLEALQLVAMEVSAACFELCFDEARFWGHNHIVYAAPGHVPQQLVQLVSSLEQHLGMHHFKFDQREYKPHVTLLRNARWTDVPLPEMQPVCWQVQDFALVQSGQQNGLANYQVLARFPLITSGG